MPAGRITWADLPARVQTWAEHRLGAPVTRVVGATGGYSPGTTDALFTADGRAGFLKAVHPSINPHSPSLIRAERDVLTRMPTGLPVAGLIDCFDEGPDGWVAILLEHVVGRQPALPWTRQLASRVSADLAALSAALTPNPAPGLSSAPEELRRMMSIWPELSGRNGLDPWLADRSDVLDELAQAALNRTGGDTLTHLDLRADNMLLRPDGSLVVVDWAWGLAAASWVDPALLLIEFISNGAPDLDVDALIDELAARHVVAVESIVGLLIGVLGFFEDAGLQPDPPGLPTVRAFQRFQGAALFAWLRTSRHTRGLR